MAAGRSAWWWRAATGTVDCCLEHERQTSGFFVFSAADRVIPVAALTAAVPDSYRALLVCAAGTGLRQEELLGLPEEP